MQFMQISFTVTAYSGRVASLFENIPFFGKRVAFSLLQESSSTITLEIFNAK
jgi:hypothetical protein